ncbi:MAG: flp pilus-assembly TadE/G-like family protein [bacterium]|nr:flp pilus-assembly TadE/G-like family protein [bacterium]
MISALAHGDDRGAAVVWTLALLSVLLAAGALFSGVAVQAVARQRVATIADLAALAGAQTSVDPCLAAESAARANEAHLIACVLDGSDVVVSVGLPAPEFVALVLRVFGGQPKDVEASARAGPA